MSEHVDAATLDTCHYPMLIAPVAADGDLSALMDRHGLVRDVDGLRVVDASTTPHPT